ncbi:uncharacterized protein BDV17DRAFT_239624 [Aspergillus undulatus]|uniref:uncharacterized protein n=1 Tax=Aspergillus undulatus TaxID=1810928 RepID=UPI003CCE2332
MPRKPKIIQGKASVVLSCPFLILVCFFVLVICKEISLQRPFSEVLYSPVFTEHSRLSTLYLLGTEMCPFRNPAMGTMHLASIPDTG